MDWLVESKKAELEYRNDSADPKKAFNFVYQVMNAVALSPETTQDNEASRISGYLTIQRTAIDDWRKQNDQLKATLNEREEELAKAKERLKTAEEALEYYAKNNHLINRTNNAGVWLAKRYGYKIAKNALKQIKESE